MKKWTCLFLSLVLCMTMVTPALAAEDDPWSGFTFRSDIKAKLFKDKVDIVVGNPYNDFLNESTLEQPWVYPTGTSFCVENLDVSGGIYVYFKTYEAGKGSIPYYEWNEETGEETMSSLDITGKYYTRGGVTYVATDSWYDEAVSAGDGLYWVSDAYVDSFMDDVFLVKPGEKFTFRMPDTDPETIYSLYATYDAGDYFYWRVHHFVMNDEVYKTAPAIPDSKNPFTDLVEDSYYYLPALWAYENNITTGTSATTFSPDGICTRGQVMTFLWRANGCPEPTLTQNPFADVKESDYFYKPILWAYENNITTGTSATAFSPHATCSSAHVLTFLWRAKGEPAPSGASALAQKYPNMWYTDALAWADSSKLLETADSDLPFAPGNNSPRADIVTYLYYTAD